MDALPLEVLVKILDYVEDWKSFIGFRQVSRHLKDAVDMSLQSKANTAIKANFQLSEEIWHEKNLQFPGFTMNVVCARFKKRLLISPKLSPCYDWGGHRKWETSFEEVSNF